MEYKGSNRMYRGTYGASLNFDEKEPVREPVVVYTKFDGERNYIIDNA